MPSSVLGSRSLSEGFRGEQKPVFIYECVDLSVENLLWF